MQCRHGSVDIGGLQSSGCEYDEMRYYEPDRDFDDYIEKLVNELSEEVKEND